MRYGAPLVGNQRPCTSHQTATTTRPRRRLRRSTASSTRRTTETAWTKRPGAAHTVPTLVRSAHSCLMRPFLLPYHHHHPLWQTRRVFGSQLGQWRGAANVERSPDPSLQVFDLHPAYFLGCGLLFHEVRPSLEFVKISAHSPPFCLDLAR